MSSLAALVVASTLAGCAGSSSTSGTPGAPARPAAAAAAASTPRPFEYAATSGQYRFTASQQQTMNMMGQSRDQAQSSMRLMTIAMARTSPDTMTMTITIDSLTISGAMGMTPPGLDKVPGSKYVAKVHPNGTFYSATGPSEAENALAASMTDELTRALPRLQAILKTGAAWTDTLKDQVKQGPLTLNREIISMYTVAGDTTVGGEVSWKITREMTVKGDGTGNAQGQDIAIQSSGKGTGLLVISKKGVLLGGQGQESATGNITMAANGMQIGLNTTTTTTVTKVK